MKQRLVEGRSNGVTIIGFSGLALPRVLGILFHRHFVSLEADPCGLVPLTLCNPTELSHWRPRQKTMGSRARSEYSPLCAMKGWPQPLPRLLNYFLWAPGSTSQSRVGFPKP